MSLFAKPTSPASEAFRTLRTSLRYSADQNNTKSLLITSVNPGDGKTLVATNLAASMAHAAERVLLIDADVRKPRCHRHFLLDNRVGLTNVLVESLDVDKAIQSTPVKGLSVLTSGPIPPNPSELLGSDAMTSLLGTVRDLYDHVIVDSSPAGALADAAILASRVDAILMVLNAGETRIDQAQEVKELLQQAKGKILGAVLNKVRFSPRDYRYRYYY